MTVLGFAKRRPWDAYRLCQEIDADIYHSCEPSMTTVLARWARPHSKHIITFRDPAPWTTIVEGPSVRRAARPRRSELDLQVMICPAGGAGGSMDRQHRPRPGPEDQSAIPTAFDAVFLLDAGGGAGTGRPRPGDPHRSAGSPGSDQAAGDLLQLPPMFLRCVSGFAGGARPAVGSADLRGTYGSAPTSSGSAGSTSSGSCAALGVPRRCLGDGQRLHQGGDAERVPRGRRALAPRSFPASIRMASPRPSATTSVRARRGPSIPTPRTSPARARLAPGRPRWRAQGQRGCDTSRHVRHRVAIRRHIAVYASTWAWPRRGRQRGLTRAGRAAGGSDQKKRRRATTRCRQACRCRSGPDSRCASKAAGCPSGAP